MKQESEHKDLKWPVVISICTFLYALLFAFFFLRSSSPETSLLYQVWKISICAFMLVGAVGLTLRKRWGVVASQIGAALVVAKSVHNIIIVFQFMGGPPPIFAVLGMLTVMLPMVAWPIFLLVWFNCKRVKSVINSEFGG